ncbi:hypothetical protein [Wohlfahrtiimonas chitiniclastica]|nr:hypothetical protein [Wohlfahrtiimonas chitiniclastica]
MDDLELEGSLSSTTQLELLAAILETIEKCAALGKTIPAFNAIRA